MVRGGWGIGTSLADKITDNFIYVAMLILIAITLYPLLHVAFASISDAGAITAHKGVLWKPLGFNLNAYRSVLANPNILSGYANTLFIVIARIIVNLTMTSFGAYRLSRKNVLWNKYFMAFIIITMFFNGGFPFYLTVKGIGLINSIWAVIIPFSNNTFNLIIMRTAFMAVPISLEESAKIDGANHFTILFRIVIPLSLPVIAVMILYYAVEKWNGWFYAVIFLKDRKLFPLQLILREILIANSTDSMSGAKVGDQFQIGETIKYATIMVATLPILFTTRSYKSIL